MSDDIATQFFEVLVHGNQGGEDAMAFFNRSSFGGGPDQAPSPRAQAVIESGEWDTKKLRLIFVDSELACWGFLPSNTAVEGGTNFYIRLCSSESCAVISHTKHKVIIDQ
jgi:hypothetical protein